jgi:hypothetical protein
MQRLAVILMSAVAVAGCGFDARVAVLGPQAAPEAVLASDVPSEPRAELPEGHPPIFRSGPVLPPGHPSILPPGHPPIPAGDCPAGGMSGFGPIPPAEANEPEIVST